jgi:oligopeptide/dipeptide ABC transporter ATP-binding protein
MREGPNNIEATTPFLQVRGLVKHFRQPVGLFGQGTRLVRAVNGVDLDIARQETVAVIGEAGCGKSVLGRCLLRLLEPTAGQVLLEGEDFLKLNPSALRHRRGDMQILFPNPKASLDPRLAIRESLAEPLRVHTSLHGDELERRIRQLLLQVDVRPDMLERRPRDLTPGQCQRIALARALALGPKLIVLDEPTVMLDPAAQAHIVSLLQTLQRRFGIAYLFLSHDLALVRQMSHRVAAMHLGQIVEQAATEALFERVRHPYTQALFATTPTFDAAAKRKRIVLPGPSNPAEPPAGCWFHPRCPVAEPICREVAPTLQPIAPEHFVACHVAMWPAG